MKISLGDFDNAQVKVLLSYHMQGMRDNSPICGVHALDWSALQKPEISFYTGWQEDELVCMGALKDLNDGTGEIKSMRVAKGQAGKGHGQAMLSYIISEASLRSYSTLLLETGTGPAFEPAVALYRKNNFLNCGAFGTYQKSDFNQFMRLVISN